MNPNIAVVVFLQSLALFSSIVESVVIINVEKDEGTIFETSFIPFMEADGETIFDSQPGLFGKPFETVGDGTTMRVYRTYHAQLKYFENDPFLCSPFPEQDTETTNDDLIAVLAARGACDFQTKADVAATFYNASYLIIHNEAPWYEMDETESWFIAVGEESNLHILTVQYFTGLSLQAYFREQQAAEMNEYDGVWIGMNGQRPDPFPEDFAEERENSALYYVILLLTVLFIVLLVVCVCYCCFRKPIQMTQKKETSPPPSSTNERINDSATPDEENLSSPITTADVEAIQKIYDEEEEKRTERDGTKKSRSKTSKSLRNANNEEKEEEKQEIDYPGQSSDLRIYGSNVTSNLMPDSGLDNEI